MRRGPPTKITAIEPLMVSIFLCQERKGMTDKEVSERSGIPTYKISRYRNPSHGMGKRVMVSDVRAMARAVGLVWTSEFTPAPARPLAWITSVKEVR